MKKTEKKYETPTVEVLVLVCEGVFAASGPSTVIGQWQEDDDDELTF